MGKLSILEVDEDGGFDLDCVVDPASTSKPVKAVGKTGYVSPDYLIFERRSSDSSLAAFEYEIFLPNTTQDDLSIGFNAGRLSLATSNYALELELRDDLEPSRAQAYFVSEKLTILVPFYGALSLLE